MLKHPRVTRSARDRWGESNFSWWKCRSWPSTNPEQIKKFDWLGREIGRKWSLEQQWSFLGEEVSQLWGRPLYIVGGTNQPLPPLCPEESGSTAVPAVLPLATLSGTTAQKRGTTAWSTAVLPHRSGTTAPHSRGQYRKTRHEKRALESRRY